MAIRKQFKLLSFKLLFISITILLAISSLLVNFNESKEVKYIRIGIATWPGFASGMIGKEKGFFQNINLEYRIIDDQPARYAAFENGDIDIIVASVDEFAQTSQRLKGKIFIVTDTSFGGDGIVAKSTIKSPEDLKGKRIAFARATPSHFLLYKVLEKHGLSPADIQEVKVDDPGHAAQAFLGGSVDAAVTWEPFLTEVKEKGKGHVLLTSRDYPGIIVDVLVASEKLAKDHNLLKEFIEGWLRSVDYIQKNPQESAQIIAKGLNIKSADVEGMMNGIRFADRDRNAYFFNDNDPAKTRIAQIFREAGSFWKSQGIIKDIPPVQNLISSFSLEYFGKGKE